MQSQPTVVGRIALATVEGRTDAPAEMGTGGLMSKALYAPSADLFRYFLPLANSESSLSS